MPSSPRGVRLRSGQEIRTRLYRQPRANVGIGPYKNNVRFQRWGRYPKKQRVFSALGALPTKSTFVFSVGGDALIAPLGTTPERSERTDTPIPSASGPMWASAPTKTTCVFSVGGVTQKNNVCFQRRGRCPHRPVGCVSRAVRKNGHGCTVSRGPM